jgi:DNA-binding MarR family transcriptional regulator
MRHPFPPSKVDPTFEEKHMTGVSAVSAWESLFRAQVAVMRHLSTEFPRGMSLNEYDVLFNLSLSPDRRCRLRDLTQQVLLTQPSISRLVDRLVSRGYVEKCPDASDGRGTVVALTPAGLDAFRAIAIEHSRSIERRVGAALDPDELAEMKRLTDKLRRGAQTS